MAEFGTLICDDYGAICDCCERAVRATRRSFWHGAGAICFACFAIWLDTSETKPEKIKAMVLAAEEAGKYPFNHSSDAERVPY